MEIHNSSSLDPAMIRVKNSALALNEYATAIRRDMHKYPEKGFLLYRTASFIVKELIYLGYDVKYGWDVMEKSLAEPLPSDEEDSLAIERALSEGADRDIVEKMRKGATGIIASIGKGSGNGKTVAYRFDIDANTLPEAEDPSHRPYREGFASLHDGITHACGHDGHIAIGLTLARVLSENRDLLRGEVRLIFQPAEEGVRGAVPMVEKGATEGVDFFFSGHIGIAALENSLLAASVGKFLASTKYEVEYFGRSAHAGKSPQEGRNALLAAAQATVALHAISRHSEGASRINVGVLTSGTESNVISDYAFMKLETRGETDKINEYMKECAERIVSSFADMYSLDYTFRETGRGMSFEPSEELASEIYSFARDTGLYDKVVKYLPMNASEDCTFFLDRVEKKGGRGIYMMFGSELSAPHHNPLFDFNEDTLPKSAALLSMLAVKYTNT